MRSLKSKRSSSVNIRPGVGILSVLRHLNYKPWFALAEFVDNSLQSYQLNSRKLPPRKGAPPLKVEIEIDRSDRMQIKIRDNAAGISFEDYGRAFRPAEIPLDRSGLSEFGMGMKSAACWFAPKWKVRTSAIGEAVTRTVTFDIARIVKDDLEELVVKEEKAEKEDHFTEITLIEPYNRLPGKTTSKIRAHLASIYRIFLREQLLELRFENDALAYEMPAVLVWPYFKTPKNQPVRWYKEFNFDFGKGLRAHGFAALRDVASTATAGFALFRRKRLIEGSWDEPYRPDKIFGSGNTFRKQRLFGEIHLEGFEVSHTKDGFKWEEHEQPFVELLHEELESTAMPMLSQAEGYRARVAQRELKAEAEKANARVAETVSREAAPVLDTQRTLPPVCDISSELATPDVKSSTRVFELSHRDVQWRITLELSTDAGVEDWLTLFDRPQTKRGPREIFVRLSLVHPFMERFCRVESTSIESLERVAVALALSEITARDSGVPQYGTIRRNVNQLLREALSKP